MWKFRPRSFRSVEFDSTCGRFDLLLRDSAVDIDANNTDDNGP
jgi:hypothetical protein